MAYETGDIVLVPFPFTDLSATRVRPAVIVSADSFEAETGDVILAMVTSQPYSGRTDFELRDWREAGLVYQSWVRIKLATLEHRLILYSPGRLSAHDSGSVEERLRLALGIQG